MRILIPFVIYLLSIFYSVGADRFQLDLQLLDPNSNPSTVTTTLHQVVVDLYPSLVGGASAYNEVINQVPVKAGIMHLMVGGTGTPLPSLDQNRFLALTVTINNGDQAVPLSPRLQIQAVPISIEAEKLGGNSFNDILGVIQASTYTDNDAITAVANTNSYLSRHGAQTSTMTLTLQNSGSSTLLSGNLVDMDISGVAPAPVTTVFGIKRNNQYLFSVLSNGTVNASSYTGDGSSLSGVVAGGGGGGALVADSVDTIHLRAGAVTASKLAVNSVLGSRIVDGQITGPKLANDTITSDKIALNAVNTTKIAINAITEAKIANGAVTTNKIAADAVLGNRIADGTITSVDIADESITFAKMATVSISSIHLTTAITIAGSLGLMGMMDITTSPDILNFLGAGGTNLRIGANKNTDQLFLNRNGTIGVGTDNPQSRLHVQNGGLCVDDVVSCIGRNTAGTIYANTTTVQGVDYAEYFESEEPLEKGDLVGLNFSTGLVRKYRAGDGLIGVVSTNPGVIGGRNRDPSTHALVALLGQVPVDSNQVQVQNRVVYTLDGIRLGWLLANGDVYLKIQ